MNKNELIAKIGEYEKKINDLQGKLDSYYEALEPQIASLTKASEEKENEKKSIEKKSSPTYLWVIAIAAVVAAIVFNSIEIGLLSGLCFVVAIAAGGYAAATKSKHDKAYKEATARVDAEIDELEDKIEAIYASDSRIEKTEKEIEELKKQMAIAQKELDKINAVEADKKAMESIGTNNLIVYCSYAAVGNKCFPILDGVERDMMTKQFALYYLNPGEHTYFINVLSAGDVIDTDDVDFTLNDSNKYIYINHDMRTYKYEMKAYDGFDEFAANFSDKKWVRDEILKLAQ